MELSLIKIDLQDTLDRTCDALKNADKRILALFGCAAGTYAAYEALEYISRSGKTNNSVLKKLHKEVRKFYNSGLLIRWRDFHFDSSYAIVNYGSYGLLPKPVMAYKRELQEEMERCPDEWFVLKLRNRWYKSCEIVAKAVGANPDNFAFVHNATEGINCVIRSINLTSNDSVLITNHTYGAIRNTVDYYTNKVGAKIVCCEIPFPINSEQEICDTYIKVLEENPGITLAVIDHITSSSALLMPIEKLVKICKDHGVLTLIDGAHAPGQLPLNIEEIGADFYAGNLHKWHFAPRGCAFIWSHSKLIESMDPSLVSHYYKRGFKDKFFRQGTDDYTNYLAGSYAVAEYYPSIGGMEHLYRTNIPMKKWAAQLFRDTWGTESPSIPSTMQAPFMEIVKMPESVTNYFGPTPDGANQCKQQLMEKYKVVMMVSGINGSLWSRVSAQICSSASEYRRSAIAVKQLAESLEVYTNLVNLGLGR